MFPKKRVRFPFVQAKISKPQFESELELKEKTHQKEMKRTWAPSGYRLSCRENEELRKQKLRDTNNVLTVFCCNTGTISEQ